jgi:hypothetical protein
VIAMPLVERSAVASHATSNAILRVTALGVHSFV